MSGVFFYTVAWPMVMMSNFFYWVNITTISQWLYQKSKKKLEWLNIENESFRDDVEKKLQISYEKQYNHLDENGGKITNLWREDIIMYANLIPIICLLLDMMLNKIKIKLGHFWFLFSINIMFLFYTYLEQRATHLPTYYDNLNWTCDAMPSYLYKKKTNRINK